MRPLVLLICVVVLGSLVATPALADPRGAACDLRGLERADPHVSCPSQQLTVPAPQPQLFGGLVSGALNSVLSKFVSWVNESAAAALRFTATLMNATTQPALQSTWFSATYWRVAGLSALLTVPFLCAAAGHALVRSDLALLGRAAFGYLPLAMLGVAIAAPLTALVLSATDEMCAFVAAAGGQADVSFLSRAATLITEASVVDASPFLAFSAGALTVAATLALWIELLVRDAAVDVIVLMLPLFFAAMVWPARRVWAVRAIETLFALILSKFAIVAVLTLGGSALGADPSGPAALLTGATLVLLAVISPWALLRILPLHEVAAAAAGGLSRGPAGAATSGASQLVGHALRPRGGGGSRDESSPAEPDVGPEADAIAALHRTVQSVGPGRTGRSARTDAGGAPSDFDDETSAVENAGVRSVPSAARPAAAAAPLASLLTASAPDDRPPIPAPFGKEPWGHFEIGDSMQAPRIAGSDTTPVSEQDPTPTPPGAAGPDSASEAPLPQAPPTSNEPSRAARAPDDPEPPAVTPPPVVDPPSVPPARQRGDEEV